MELKIYNMLGQEIRTLVKENYIAGNYSVHWDGKDNYGNAVLSGVYIYKFRAGQLTQIKKMTLLR